MNDFDNELAFYSTSFKIIFTISICAFFEFILSVQKLALKINMSVLGMNLFHLNLAI